MTDKALINPVREKNEPLLPETGFFYVNPPDANHIAAELKSLQSESHFLFNSRLFTINGTGSTKYFVAGPSVGAPMAAMTLEKLIALGIKKVIMYGWCGSLSEKLEIGSILLPTWGIPGEGTSGYYPGNDRPSSSEKLRDLISDFFQNKRIDFQSGPMWTTDAVYRETKVMLNEMSKRNVVGVDMEYTALARVAEYRNIDFAAIFLVSDELWREDWVPGFKDPQFKKMNKKVSSLILGLAEKMESLKS